MLWTFSLSTSGCEQSDQPKDRYISTFDSFFFVYCLRITLEIYASSTFVTGFTVFVIAYYHQTLLHSYTLTLSLSHSHSHTCNQLKMASPTSSTTSSPRLHPIYLPTVDNRLFGTSAPWTPTSASASFASLSLTLSLAEQANSIGSGSVVFSHVGDGARRQRQGNELENKIMEPRPVVCWSGVEERLSGFGVL